MCMKTTAIIANGLIIDYPYIKQKISEYDRIIAVDGGVYHCRKMEIVPDLLVGDFDSANSGDMEFYKNIAVSTFPVDKDDTDLELALRLAKEEGSEMIALFGALGKRIDHGLLNLDLIRQHPGKVLIESDYETITGITGTQTISCFPGQTVSFIPFGEVGLNISSVGLKWELQHADISKNFYSVSNICLGDSFQIKIETGVLLCCRVRLL